MKRKNPKICQLEPKFMLRTLQWLLYMTVQELTTVSVICQSLLWTGNQIWYMGNKEITDGSGWSHHT